MDINNQTLGQIKHNDNDLPDGIDPLMEYLCLEYKRGNLTEDNQEEYIKHISQMLKDREYDNKFVNQTRVIFNAANKVENEEKEHYNSDDELNDNDLKELNKYKNDLSNNSKKDFDKEKALKCGFFLDEVNYDFNYTPKVDLEEETKINNDLINV